MATSDRGTSDLLEAVWGARDRMEASGALAGKRRRHLRRQLEGAVRERLMGHVLGRVLGPGEVEKTVARMADRAVDPQTAADDVVARSGVAPTGARIDHLGVAVASLDEAVTAWEALGFVVDETHDVPTEQVRAAFLPLGTAHVELLEPTAPGSVIARFLEKRSGLHHVCVLVEDLEASLAQMKARGVTLVDETPRVGAGGCRVAFVHPRSASGVLLELKEMPREGASDTRRREERNEQRESGHRHHRRQRPLRDGRLSDARRSRYDAVRTPRRTPSWSGTLEGKRVAFCPATAGAIGYSPPRFNFRANIFAMKSLGVEWILSVSAVGVAQGAVRAPRHA